MVARKRRACPCPKAGLWGQTSINLSIQMFLPSSRNDFPLGRFKLGVKLSMFGPLFNLLWPKLSEPLLFSMNLRPELSEPQLLPCLIGGTGAAPLHQNLVLNSYSDKAPNSEVPETLLPVTVFRHGISRYGTSRHQCFGIRRCV